MAEPTRRRPSTVTRERGPVRLSVPIDVETHARLCATAALQGRDRGAIAAEILADALRAIVIIDRRKSPELVPIGREGNEGAA